jgi:hypothetical protein
MGNTYPAGRGTPPDAAPPPCACAAHQYSKSAGEYPLKIVLPPESRGCARVILILAIMNLDFVQQNFKSVVLWFLGPSTFGKDYCFSYF